MAPEVFVAAVFDMRKSVFLFVEKLNFVSRETIMPIFNEADMYAPVGTRAHGLFFVFMLLAGLCRLLSARVLFFLRNIYCV